MQNGKCHKPTLSKDALYCTETGSDATRFLSKGLEGSLDSHPFCALCLLRGCDNTVTMLHKSTIITGAGWEAKFLFYRKFQLVNILFHRALEQNVLALQPFWQKWSNLFLCQLTSPGSQETNRAVGILPGS